MSSALRSRILQPLAVQCHALASAIARPHTHHSRHTISSSPALLSPFKRTLSTLFTSDRTVESVSGEPEKVSLSKPLRGFENPKYAVVDLSRPPTTQITQLDNGLAVASEDSPGAFAVVGVSMEAGTRFEEKDATGIFHFLDRMAYKSTVNHSQRELVAELEKLGGSAFCQGSRDCMVYYMCVFNKDVDRAMELLAESVLNPALAQSEIEEQRQLVLFEKEDMLQRPEIAVTELMYEAAYSQSSMGQPLICPDDTINAMTPELLHKYHKQYYIAPRMVVAAAGVPHEKLLSLTKQHFANVPSAPATPLPEFAPQTYVGGALQKHSADLKHANVILAYEGLPWDHDDIYALCTLQMLMGGGASFSAGGPGKGMHSRLMTRVLNRYYWIESCMAQLTSHKDTGLFYMHGTCDDENVHNLMRVMEEEFEGMASAVTDTELSRAQNQLKSHLLMNLESRVVQFDDISKQILTTGKRIQPLELCRHIDLVTKEDLGRVARRMLAGKPTSAIYGNLDKMSPSVVAQTF
ncbi:hypothetical protein SARC_05353 [Sphaeroforma arctica JP610]|uniref:Mitochondrial-processing peptidase subunit alpha n=1 Tax=Sphaeroforma arctica JP610 TaxID=667725 RepID=A0A0L0FZW0_9EUKA|nr:hypothetical protein SARC_05353 [Sphaeroforma arctica JP610]KNC82360.1 hypothetical protein SARC_05353 [Sphaeroforma arctica JP610]|eukprot:XP_014156262.1 hypothetical protein SARC_05353 [Sphaeroforma arctica JP610]